MTSASPVNITLVAGGVVVAAAIWACAILLPAPAARDPAAPNPAPLSIATQPTTPEPEHEPVMAAPAVTPAAPQESLTEIAQRQSSIAPAPADPMVFGALPMSMESPAPSPRVSILEAAGSVPLTSMALASTPLHSIGAAFANTVIGVGPELGGASVLDGPADSGLDVPVARSDEAELAGAAGPPPPRGKIIVLDASEGTKLDPLRQRNWDLNAVQVIPPMPTSASPRR